jgi:hypothetical protein
VPQLPGGPGGASAAVWDDFDGEQFDHVVMLDPEGNEFCVA